jgi:hypothetical protein
MAVRKQLDQKVFDDIYHKEVVEALEKDRQLDFASITEKYLQKGVCPKCGERSLYIAREQPFQLKCNRLNQCQHEERTRERYSDLFENLSERFPKTEENPNATADAYLQRNRGFDTTKLQGWYEQGRRRLKNEQWVDTVRFPLCNGYWERIIDATAVAANDGDKASIKYGMSYKGNGWVPPGMTIEKHDRIYVVEGIFHAIALYLAGFKAIASISANNFPLEIVEANKGRLITWVIALDDDRAGHLMVPKYMRQLRDLRELVAVALAGDRDWDDVYRDGQLDQAFMDETLYQGRLFTASSPMHKAYLLYLRRQRTFFLIEFGNRLFSARVNMGELKEALGDDTVDGNRPIFTQHATIQQVANCIPRFEYIEKDAITSEQRYFFQFDFPNAKQTCKEPLSPSAISEPRGFTKALLERTPGGMFEGGERVLAMLKGDWFTNVRTVRTLPYVGYDETTKAYCYPQFGFHKGVQVMTNEHGFLDVGSDGLKTSSRNFVMFHSNTFNPDWFTDFRAVNSLNGLAALGWWTGSLFAQQIRAKQSSWPFMELTGEANAGKSTLLRFLWRLVGRKDEEGIKPSGSGASAIGLLRALGGVSNLPVVLLESDKESVDSLGRTVSTQYNWDEIKPLFDHNAKLRVIGVKSANNDTDSLIFRGAVMMSQNTSVDGSEAILTRIVHLHATRDHHTPELKPLADRIKSREVEGLCGFLGACLTQEQAWLQRYFDAFPFYEQRFQCLGGINNSRIVLCHAQVMAAAKATQPLLPDWSDRDMELLAKHLESRALDRQQRCSAEDPIAAQFWQIYHYLNERVVTITDAEGTREEVQETLNHSADRDLIAINIEHFIQACKLAGQEVIASSQLRRAFPKSRTHTFIESGKRYSRIERRGLNCWVFKRYS